MIAIIQQLLNRIPKKELPCIKFGALPEGTIPDCHKSELEQSLIKPLCCCPMCDKMSSEIDQIESSTYKAGYAYVAWVVRRGSKCELVAFQDEQDEETLRQRYGEDLIAVVPLRS